MAGEISEVRGQVRARVAQADRLRRIRDAGGRLWRLAPAAAGLCLGVAMLARWVGWSPLVPVAAIALAAAFLALLAANARRNREISDIAASAVDTDAGLNGELRSAHWFARNGAPDPWVEYHLAHAAERIGSVDWTALYPAPRAPRAKVATGVMGAAALAVALSVPGRAATAAGPGSIPLGPGARAAQTGQAIELLPPQLRKELEDLLAAIESGRGTSISESDVRGLLDRIDQRLAQQPSKLDPPRSPDARAGRSAAQIDAAIKALAARAKRDSQMASLQPEVRDALDEMSEKLSEATRAQNATPKDPRDAMASSDTQKGDAQSANGGNKEEASVQSVKEASAGSGIGIIMMTSDGSNAKESGLGLGGSDGKPANRTGQLPNLGAALRHETIEASMDDRGENVLNGARRRTEHTDARIGYAHTAPASAERGNSTAPPPVPEGRRATVRSYFTRKP